ncbi:hypothetical protein [Pararhizobium sp. IMCC21322]|uniref:hypothetical protein n=1 Tax=Pararhizobium sp. IMCC21322 TaxID=3067903 RepID=UPI002741F064|nr:hypothetical protein [Pararhizobium sp. IMCC21322]
MGMPDAIGHLDRVSFEDTMVPDLGTMLWFEADFSVEADSGSYAFFVQRIYTQQASPEGAEGYFPVPTNTAAQIILELELRSYLETNQGVRELLCELADGAGLEHWLHVAA